LVRQKEKIWIDTYKNKTMTDYEIIKTMVENPILIERPIVINGEKAVIARPLENAKSIL
jgi:arsenate reductase